MACSGVFGVPDTTRTCDPGLRRLVLYPTELLGHISKIFNFHPPTDSNELPLRRLVLYPTELRGLIQKIFNFHPPTDSNELPLRRRMLYPAELQRHFLFSPARGCAVIITDSLPKCKRWSSSQPARRKQKWNVPRMPQAFPS